MKKRICVLVAIVCMAFMSITACSSNGTKNNGATDNNANETKKPGIIEDTKDAIESAMPKASVAPTHSPQPENSVVPGVTVSPAAK